MPSSNSSFRQAHTHETCIRKTNNNEAVFVTGLVKKFSAASEMRIRQDMHHIQYHFSFEFCRWRIEIVVYSITCDVCVCVYAMADRSYIPHTRDKTALPVVCSASRETRNTVRSHAFHCIAHPNTAIPTPHPPHPDTLLTYNVSVSF